MSDPTKTISPLTSEDNAIRALIRCYGLVERVLQPYFARFGISGAQWGVLRQLHRAELEGKLALRMTELSQRLLVRLPSATGVIDRLVRDGLVRRASMAKDLRVKQISLTEKGRRCVQEVLADHQGQLENLLGGLNLAERETLRDLLTRLRIHLDGLLEQAPASAESDQTVMEPTA